MGAPVIAADHGLEQGFARAGLALIEGEKAETDHGARELPHEGLVGSDQRVLVQVAVALHADGRVEQNGCSGLARGPGDHFLVRAMQVLRIF